MARPKKSTISSRKIALYDQLIATNPKIERKGAANPYTSLNGNILHFCISPTHWPSDFLRTSERTF
jgi:hypothetical protein